MRQDRQQGVALVLLLMMLAAMTLMVTGVAGQARVDTRLTQVALQQAQAGKLMLGYVHVALRDLARDVSGQAVGRSVPYRRSYRDGDAQVEVEIYPTSGLLDPASASPELLASVFRYGGRMPMREARTLANRVVRARSRADTAADAGGGTTARSFVVLEDLLRVPGMRWEIYEKIAGLLQIGGAARPSPQVAVESLLPAMAEGNRAQLVAWRRQRAALGRDAAGGKGGSAAIWSGREFDIRMTVKFVDSASYERRVSVRPAVGGSPPWVFHRVFPVTAVPVSDA